MTTEKPTEKQFVLHCWEGGPLTDDGCSTTCMLPHDHEGPHQWTRDDKIEISFPVRAAE